MAKAKPQRVPIKLSRAARTALGMSGFFSFIVGVFAIFRPTSTEIGGVALIVLAGVFGLLAAIGVFPSRVTAAGITADMSFFEEAAEGASPTEKRRIADEAESASPEDPLVQAFSARMRSAAYFEEAVLAELSRHPDISLDTSSEAVRFRLGDPARMVAVDAVITISGRRWAVEVRAFTQTSSLRHALRRLILAMRFWDFEGALLITDREPAELILGQGPPYVLVVDDLARLHEQVLWLVERAQ